MPGKIFFRKRQRYVDGAGMPRYLLMAVAGLNIEVYGQHLRMSELKAIAEATGAELVENTQQPATIFNSDMVSCGRTPRTLEMLLIEASGKAQFLLDADDADERTLLSIFTDAERKQFLSLLTKFVEKEPKNGIC
jgi:hypothetical protein